MTLTTALKNNKKLRIIGFDDAPFEHHRGSKINISGIVCSQTRMEGMLWCEATKDGKDATHAIGQAVLQSKFHPQLHAVLIDGIAVGGFNIIDLPSLSTQLKLPCIAVMRKPPDMAAIERALMNFEDGEQRWQQLEKAGEIHCYPSEKHQCHFYFQVVGCSPQQAFAVLEQTTDNGGVPEALRLAHLIGAAVKTGQSNNRA